MLSVCIPVFNHKIENLIGSLAFQLSTSGLDHEILIADDGSDLFYKQENEIAARKFGAMVISLEKNIGRSAIRNLLCKEAQFENLLFMDCDSGLESNDFVLKYKPFINKPVVVYGGRKYREEKPSKDYRLHWKYGHKRESMPASVREKFPSKFFSSNNFMIAKNILQKYSFDESLIQYGHEDTLLGIVFSQNNIPVFHIENPVVHERLENNEVFILKTEEGIRNLLVIAKKVPFQEVGGHIRLLKLFSLVEKARLVSAIGSFWMFSRPVLRYLLKNLHFMCFLDLYKIGYFCFLNKKAPFVRTMLF